MTEKNPSLSRRRLLKRLALGMWLGPAAAAAVRQAHADSESLLKVDSPEAKAVHYTEDVKKAGRMASRGAKCSNCGLYQGSITSTVGDCSLFPGKKVRAGGWCSSWQGQM